MHYGDEVDRMPAPVRIWWFRRLAATAGVAAIGTHRDLSGSARRAGLVVTTHLLDPIDRPTLARIVERRMAVARLPAGGVGAGTEPSRGGLQLSAEDIAEVHRRSGGSIRMAEELLHLLVAERVDQHQL
jgi:hypothetical protein